MGVFLGAPIRRKTRVEMCERGSSPTILYIEDDPANRILVQRIMEAEGYRVLLAENGPEGVMVACQEFPDLILVDISMPDMDGYSVATRLRREDGMRDVPIVALTANVMKGDRERSLEAGCSGYIQKPLDVDRLPAQVVAFLHAPRGGGS
jgi:two-component system cell cycle response regulator DivK